MTMERGVFVFLESLSTNKMFVGLTMILMNMGSRFIVGEISPAQQAFLGHYLVKPLIVFCMFFVPTRDVIVSIMLTFAFFFVVNNLMNEHKNVNILGKEGFDDGVYAKYVARVRKRSANKT